MHLKSLDTEERKDRIPYYFAPLEISEEGLPFKLDQGIADFLPELTSDEVRRLEESIKKVGCEYPLVVWKEENILIDGHHRLALCQKHKKPYQHVFKSFPCRAEALIWMMDTNKGRRGHGDSPFFDCEKVIIECEEYFKANANERKREAGKNMVVVRKRFPNRMENLFTWTKNWRSWLAGLRKPSE